MSCTCMLSGIPAKPLCFVYAYQHALPDIAILQRLCMHSTASGSDMWSTTCLGVQQGGAEAVQACCQGTGQGLPEEQGHSQGLHEAGQEPPESPARLLPEGSHLGVMQAAAHQVTAVA